MANPQQAGEESPLNRVGDTELMEIFKYFEAEKLETISRVCGRFRRGAHGYQILRRIQFYRPVPDISLEDLQKSPVESRSISFGPTQQFNLDTLQNASGRFSSIRSIRFDRSDLTGEFLNLLPELLPAVTSLTCFRCQIPEIPGVLGQLHRLVRLRHLDLHNTVIRDASELLNFMNALPPGQLHSLKFMLQNEAYVHLCNLNLSI